MLMPFLQFGTGYPLIFLHAFPLNKSMWKLNIKPCIDLGFKVITPDFRGFGENNLQTEQILMEDLAADIKELMNHLSIRKAVLLGLSMGGYVAFNFLNQYPRKISSLILCDTTFRDDSDEKRKARYKLVEKINSKGSVVLVDEMLPNLLSENSLKNNKQLVDHLSNEFIGVIPQSAVAALRGMAQRINHQKLLKMIDVPTLLLFGENDNITNLETARNMKEQIQGAELKIIKKAGHYPNLENPVKFNFYLTNFLTSLKI